MIRWLDDMVIRCHQRQKLPKFLKVAKGYLAKLAKIKKSSKEVQKKNGKSWQKMAKNTKSSWKDDKKFITSWHLTLRDIWNFITCWQVDKLTSSTLWRVDMLTSYQEFRIIWFWAPKFETTIYSLTYLLDEGKV